MNCFGLRLQPLFLAMVTGSLVMAAAGLWSCSDEDDGDARVEGTEAGDCSDTLDNDRDGMIDCADDSCALAQVCGGGDVSGQDSSAADADDTGGVDTIADSGGEDTGGLDTSVQTDTNLPDTSPPDDTNAADVAADTASDTTPEDTGGTDTMTPPACQPACDAGDVCVDDVCAPEFVFEGTSLSRGIASVPVGGVASFRNASTFDTHSVDFDDAAMTDVPPLASGAQVIVPFDTAGTWNFRCGQHPARIQEAGAVVAQ